MKSCIRLPRILIPRDHFPLWPVIACDQFTSDRAYWERVREAVGNEPSTLDFILPEVYLGEEDEERIEHIHENMYRALESDWLVKLDRGFVFTVRTLPSGAVRKGIVAAFDLEEYSCETGVRASVRSSEAVVPSRLPPRVAVRRGAPLEFPHAVIFYRDKKDKAVSLLEDEDLEKIYEFDCMEGGGKVEGYFIPADLAQEVAEQMYSRGEPCFAVADGNHSIAAAKQYWEEIKAGITEREAEYHPARFALAEFENIYSDAVEFFPIHRLVKQVDAEAFCDFFSRAVRCKRNGKVLYPDLPAGAEGVARTDELIERFLAANTGAVDYIHGDEELCALAKEENSVGIALKAVEKEDFFEQLKGGKNFPKKTFSLGEGREKRYYVEGKEISYD